MLAKERMAAMGFPITAELARFGAVRGMPEMRESEYRRMVGNAMHVASMGAMWLTALASVQFRTSLEVSNYATFVNAVS
jgi:hypothetical protein